MSQNTLSQDRLHCVGDDIVRCYFSLSRSSLKYKGKGTKTISYAPVDKLVLLGLGVFVMAELDSEKGIPTACQRIG